MTKFKALPKRYDDALANDGVWFEPNDAAGLVWPMFKLALLDTTSNRFIEVAEKLSDQAAAKAKNGFRQPARLSKREKSDEDVRAFARNFIEISMVDWTVEGEDGEVIPFTKELAIEFFDVVNDSTKRWLLKTCVEFASDNLNYAPEGQTEAPEKN